MYSTFNDKFPANFNDYFTKYDQFHNKNYYNTQSASNIHINIIIKEQTRKLVVLSKMDPCKLKLIYEPLYNNGSRAT